MWADERQAGVLWQKQRREEIAAAAAAGGIVVLPFGSIEQHGPHLPLDTDAVSATAIAVQAATRVHTPPVLVLPTVWWGLSPYWMVFPGTITLRPETLLALLTDIGSSVSRHGFRRMVIVNGHGGNTGIIQVAAIQAAEYGLRVAALSYWNLIVDEMQARAERDIGTIGHAGEMETSIQLYLQPGLVKQELAAPDLCADVVAMETAPFATVASSPPDPRRESPHGIYGYAPAGRRELGEALVTLAAERLARFIEQFASQV